MDGCVVRLRGLPWSTTPDDLVKFFSDCQIAGGDRGVHLTISREGRASGEAFVEFASEEDVEKAVEKHNSHMGSRYIEVFRSKKSEMEWVVKRSGADHSNMTDACVKLRGLPFGCSKEEIAQFFTGLEIVPNGIMLPEDRLGRSTGEAYVQFASQDIAEGALGKHKDRIGHRYIEIFKSSLAEANAVTGRDRGGNFRGGMGMGRPGPYDRGDRFGGPMGAAAGPMGMGFNRGRGGRNVKGYFEEEYDEYNGGGFGFGGRGGRGGGMRGRFPGMMDDRRGNGPPGSQYMSKTGHSVHMRGLPFQAQEQDIFEFFTPLQPVRVNFEFGDNGRPTGEANVDFATHQEAMEAMKKHKSNMQHRYIELFLNSTASERGGSDGGGGGYDASDMGAGFGGTAMGNTMASGGYGNNGAGFGGANNMSGGYGNMGGNSMTGGSMMGSSGSGMGGGYGNQSGQYGGSQQYNNGSMGTGGGYSMGGSGQSTGYGNQGGMSGSYMGGNGGGYSNMGSSAMSNLANPNYTAF